eukprot:3826245-Alexandrium_andersonii.AAC.1
MQRCTSEASSLGRLASGHPSRTSFRSQPSGRRGSQRAPPCAARRTRQAGAWAGAFSPRASLPPGRSPTGR